MPRGTERSHPAPSRALSPGGPGPERELSRRFVAALERRFDALGAGERARVLRTMRHAQHPCSRCAEACHVYLGSGGDPRHRPGLRADILRRIYRKYVKGEGALSRWWNGDCEIDDAAIAALAQMAYECNLCERCSRSCRSGDHALIARELRAIFRDIGIHPPGPRRIDAAAVRDAIAEIDKQTSRRTGIPVHTPWDVEGADVLLVQPAPSVSEWEENVGAAALVLTCSGIRWTMSSELAADDPSRWAETAGAEVAVMSRRYDRVAAALGAKRIVVGESGAAYEALCTDPRAKVARQSVVELLRGIVRGGRLRFDPLRNDFPVTLHDPCRLARHGVVEPQREILRRLCPQFREMDPWAEKNFCCGGGGGVVDIKDAWSWRIGVAGHKKMEQIIDAFPELADPTVRKYVCAPCGSCKTQLQDLFAEHAPWQQNRIFCGGIAELVANAMEDVPPGFLRWETEAVVCIEPGLSRK